MMDETNTVSRITQRLNQSTDFMAIDNRSRVLEVARKVALDILSSQTGVEALRHIAEAAKDLAGAQYAALGVARLDGQGLAEFVTVGLTHVEEARIGPRPEGRGILGLLLKRKDALRIDRLGDHESSVGFPPNHPQMDSFLGVPIRRGESVLGSLYLTNKVGGGPFTEADEAAVEELGAHAAIAVHNLQMLTRQRKMVSGLITAQEEERRAVAYDLHDGLTQYVMAAHAHLESFKRAYSRENRERAEHELEQGLRYLKEAVVESRRLVNGLRTLALDDLGLAGALEQLITEEKFRAGWEQADFIHNIAGRRFDKMLETTVYRVAQEALTNARKHSETNSVRLSLALDNDSDTETPVLRLEVRDYGKGFDPAEGMNQEPHVGIQGIIERIGLMNGSYRIVSSPGEGAVLSARFPVMPEHEEDAE